MYHTVSKIFIPFFFKRRGRWVSEARTHLLKLREHSETEKIKGA